MSVQIVSEVQFIIDTPEEKLPSAQPGTIWQIALTGAVCGDRGLHAAGWGELGAPPATVSQVEKGQRALKEPKIAAWAAALYVSEDDLRELWELSQGLVPVGSDRLFYSDRTDALGSAPLDAEIIKTLREQPELEAIYRLAVPIAVVMKRLRPNASVQVERDQFDIPFMPHAASP